jgi:hypothetical protein
MREFGDTIQVQLKKGQAFIDDLPNTLPRARIYPKLREINHAPYEAFLGEIFVGTYKDIADAVLALFDALRDSGTYSNIHYVMPRSDVTLLAFTYDPVEPMKETP